MANSETVEVIGASQGPASNSMEAAPTFCNTLPEQIMVDDESGDEVSSNIHLGGSGTSKHDPGWHFRQMVLPRFLQIPESVEKKNISEPELRRVAILQSLTHNGVQEVVVHRENICEDVLTMYADSGTLNKGVEFSIAKEEGVDLEGLRREVFTLFWKEGSMLFLEGCGGNFIPRHTGLIRSQYVVLGRVLSHGYIAAGVFPAFLNRAYMQALLFGEASLTYDILLQSLLDFLPLYERERLIRILCDRELASSDGEFLLDLEERAGVTMMPSIKNCNTIAQLVSRSVLIEAPMHTMGKIREGMPEVPGSEHLWSSSTTAELMSLYEELQPSPGKVAALLDATCQTPEEKRVFTYLKRYTRALSQEECVKLLRWITGSETVNVPHINVQFHKSQEQEPYPRVHTCTAMIYISSTGYATYNIFRCIMDSILKNEEAYKFTTI